MSYVQVKKELSILCVLCLLAVLFSMGLAVQKNVFLGSKQGIESGLHYQNPVADCDLADSQASSLGQGQRSDHLLALNLFLLSEIQSFSMKERVRQDDWSDSLLATLFLLLLTMEMGAFITGLNRNRFLLTVRERSRRKFYDSGPVLFPFFIQRE